MVYPANVAATGVAVLAAVDPTVVAELAAFVDAAGPVGVVALAVAADLVGAVDPVAADDLAVVAGPVGVAALAVVAHLVDAVDPLAAADRADADAPVVPADVAALAAAVDLVALAVDNTVALRARVVDNGNVRIESNAVVLLHEDSGFPNTHADKPVMVQVRARHGDPIDPIHCDAAPNHVPNAHPNVVPHPHASCENILVADGSSAQAHATHRAAHNRNLSYPMARCTSCWHTSYHHKTPSTDHHRKSNLNSRKGRNTQDNLARGRAAGMRAY